MIRLKLLAITALFITAYGCKQQETSSDLVCDTLEYAGNVKIKDISEITSGRKIFLAEANENSLIGNTLRRVIQHDSLIVILDNMKQVLAFDADGRHKFTIHNVGQGPGEYLNLADIAVYPGKNELLLLTYTQLLRYSLSDGSYIGKAADFDAYFDEIVVKDDVAYLLRSTYTNNELAQYNVSTFNLRTSAKSDYMPPVEEFAPFCKFGENNLNLFGNGVVAMTRKFDSHIYSLKEDNFEAIFDTDWGTLFLRPESGTHYDSDELSMKTLKSKEVFTLSGLQMGDSIMTFTTNVPQFYYANLNTKEIFSSAMVKDSEFPLFTFSLSPLTGSDGWVFAQFNRMSVEMAAKADSSNEALNDLSAQMDDDANPLIIFYKLK